jgi:hypothetical protein
MIQQHDSDEVMAVIHFDFPSGPRRVTGSEEVRKLSSARVICHALNEIYGEGTHWVEALDKTWADRRGAADLH